MEFSKKEIQKEVDRIQRENDTPEFMLVEVPCGFYIDKEDGYFREEETTEAYFMPKSKNRNELITDLATALIELSL